MEVQIEVGKGIQCDGIEIMFGNSISSVVKAVGEVDKYEDNYYFYESSLLVHVDSNNCIDEIEIRNDEEHSHVVMLNGTNIFSEMKDVVIELIARLNQSPAEVIIIHTGYDITHTGIFVIKLLQFWQIMEKAWQEQTILWQL